MTVHVEFYGIPRERAGVASIDIEAANLGEALARLSDRLPDLAAACISAQTLRSGYLASINGTQFTSDVAAQLQPGDSLLILSADAGG